MPQVDPAVARLCGLKGSAVRGARRDPGPAMEHVRAGKDAKLHAQVLADAPDLRDEREIQRRADQLRHQHMIDMALKARRVAGLAGGDSDA